MTDKYYYPEIEEFHIGFEYEYISKKQKEDNSFEDIWTKKLCDFNTTVLLCDAETHKPINQLFHSIKNKSVRVKFLDKEDLDSLGFKDGLFKGQDCIRIKDGYYISHFKDNHLTIDNGERYEAYWCYFDGTIKNKGELIKLMKQLGI